jgi:hypothetical protein
MFYANTRDILERCILCCTDVRTAVEIMTGMIPFPTQALATNMSFLGAVVTRLNTDLLVP